MMAFRWALCTGKEQLAAAKPNYQTKPAQTDRLATVIYCCCCYWKAVAEQIFRGIQHLPEWPRGGRLLTQKGSARTTFIIVVIFWSRPPPLPFYTNLAKERGKRNKLLTQLSRSCITKSVIKNCFEKQRKKLVSLTLYIYILFNISQCF